MEKKSNNRSIREMLGFLEKRPATYLWTNENRVDYLSHFLDGWLLNNKEPLINYKYHMGITQWTYEWLIKNKYANVNNLEYIGPKYKMIYAVTGSEEEAWKLFFKISYEYLDYLESEETQKMGCIQKSN